MKNSVKRGLWNKALTSGLRNMPPTFGPGAAISVQDLKTKLWEPAVCIGKVGYRIRVKLLASGEEFSATSFRCRVRGMSSEEKVSK
jgi:hypothetical protein